MKSFNLLLLLCFYCLLCSCSRHRLPSKSFTDGSAISAPQSDVYNVIDVKVAEEIEKLKNAINEDLLIMQKRLKDMEFEVANMIAKDMENMKKIKSDISSMETTFSSILSRINKNK